MSIGTRLYTLLFGQLMGQDRYGNRYYRRRGGHAPGRFRREMRWVLYKGEPEASKVPPEWFGWLHYSQNEPPKPGEQPARPWQKEHLPNLTGTPLAYHPPGSAVVASENKPKPPYEAWRP